MCLSNYRMHFGCLVDLNSFHILQSLSCCCRLVEALGSTGRTKQRNHLFTVYLLILFVN